MCVCVCVDQSESECVKDVQEMMRTCWKMDAAQRPSFSQLVHWLQSHLRPMTRDNFFSISSSVVARAARLTTDPRLTQVS